MANKSFERRVDDFLYKADPVSYKKKYETREIGYSKILSLAFCDLTELISLLQDARSKTDEGEGQALIIEAIGRRRARRRNLPDLRKENAVAINEAINDQIRRLKIIENGKTVVNLTSREAIDAYIIDHPKMNIQRALKVGTTTMLLYADGLITKPDHVSSVSDYDQMDLMSEAG